MYKFILYNTASYMLKTNPHIIIFQLLNPNFIQEGETYIRQLMQITFIYSLNKLCDKAKRLPNAFHYHGSTRSPNSYVSLEQQQTW